nr:DNA (apurinic or apyrimidinic site) lyase [Hymenolepis microstoma]
MMFCRIYQRIRFFGRITDVEPIRHLEMNPSAAMAKLCTWNINGIRSFSKPFKAHLDQLDADIICLQETKAGRDLPAHYSRVDGYNAYFAHCKTKSGYAGVSIFCRDPLRPIRAYDSLLDLCPSQDFDKALDSEGRALIVQFQTDRDDKLLSVISVYCPRVDPDNQARAEFKTQFLQLLRSVVHKLIEDGSYVILAGDLNICHKPIDHCCPEYYMSLQRAPIDWLDEMLSASMVDTFRLAHPDRKDAFTCWNTKMGARHTNYGTRIDYILFDKSLMDLFTEINESLSDIMQYIEGSDHCPVWAKLPLNINTNESGSLPSLCSHFWPQCQKRQLSLSEFVKKWDKIESTESARSGAVNTQVPEAQDGKRIRQTRLDFVFKPQESSPKLKKPPVSTKEERDEKLLYDESDLEREIERRKSTTAAWQSLLNGSKKSKSIPLCTGHGEPCVLRCVKRADSRHRGREFWTCARPIGAPNNPLARCNTFFWK